MMEKPANSSSIDDFFRSRQKSFLASLEHALSLVSSDDEIQQMFHNPKAANYLPTRITELISDTLHDDREKYILTLKNHLQAYETLDDKMDYRTPSFKFDQKKISRQKKIIKSIKTINYSISSTVSNFSNDIRSVFSNARHLVSTTINSLVHDNKQLNNRLESLNRQSKSLSRDNDDLKRQLSISQSNLSRSQQQFNELTEILETKENDLANMKSINYNLSSSLSNARNFNYNNTSSPSPSSLQKRKQKSNSFLSHNDFNNGSFSFNNDNNAELLTEYKQKLDDAYQQIQNLKSQLQINDQGEMMQSLVYASQTIKTKDQQIQELQNHIKDLNKEVQSLGNQIQALTAQGTSPTKKVTFQNLNQNDRYCSYDEFEHMMNERNNLADQLDAIQSESSKSERQKKLLENKINELMQQKSETEREFHNQIQELQAKNKQLSLSLKDTNTVGELLNKEKSDNEKKSVIIRQKDALIQSLTKENAKLIGQFTVLSRIDEQTKNNEEFSLEILLDSANFDPQQKKIITKIFNESQKRNDQKISKLEQALRNKIKSENALKQDIEKVNLTVDNNQKLIEQKQKQIEDLNVSSSLLQNEKSQSDTKIIELKTKIVELESKVEELQINVSSKQKQIDDFRSIFESFKAQKESLEERINQIQQENAAEVKRLQNINTDISEQSFTKEREVEKAQKTNQQLQEEIQKVKNQNEQLLLINKQSQETIESNKNLSKKIDSYKKAHQESKKQLTILASSNQQLQNKLKAKRNQVSQQVELINKMQKTIDSVNSEKNTLITDLQAKMKHLEEENAILRSNTMNNRPMDFYPNTNFNNTSNSQFAGQPMQTAQQTMTPSQLLSTQERDISNLKSLQRQLELSQNAKESAEKQLSALQTENENLMNSIQQSENENEKLNKSINELNSNLSKIQLENQKQMDTNNKLQNENRKLQYENEQHQEENSKLQKANSKLQSSIQKQQDENNKLQSSIQQQQEENNRLQITNNKLQMGVQRQQEENSKLQSSNNKLQKTNSKQQEQINKLQDDVNKNQRLNEKQTEENNRLKRTTEKQQDDNNKLQNELDIQKEENNKLQNENKKLSKINEKQIEENNRLTKINDKQNFENEQLQINNEKQQEEINELHKINDTNQRELQAKIKQSENQAAIISELQQQLQTLNNTNQKILKKASRIVNVSEITQIPSKLDELNTIIVKIRELLNLKKSEDVISAIVNLLRQIQYACQNLNIRDPNDFQNATVLLAKEIEENRKFKEDFTKREQKISSILNSTYSFETIPETLIKYQKFEQEIVSILRCQNSSVATPEIQLLVKFESSIEKALGCSTKEEAVKDTIQLKSNEKIIERILGIEDANKIPRAIEDLFNDVQQLKKSLVVDDFHSAIPVFIQIYSNLKKIMKNSDSFEKIFADLLEIVVASKHVSKICKAENLESSIQVIQSMKETINKAESEIDSKSIEGESLPQKVAEMTNRCKVLNQAVNVLDVDNYNSVVGAIQLLLDQMNQIKAIVVNGKSLPIPTTQFSKSSKSPKFNKISPNSDNQEVIQEVASMKNECLNLAQMLDVSEDSIVPKVAELLDQMKQISAVFISSNSIYQSRSNSSSFNNEIIELVNKQNQQIQKMSEMLSSDPDRIVESVAKMNQQMRKISEIMSPNEDHLHNENLVDSILKQNQQLKRIMEIFNNSSNFIGEIIQQNQQLKKIMEVYNNSDNFIDEIIQQNQQIKSIMEIYSPSEDIVNNVLQDHQNIKKIEEIYPDSSNVVDDVVNNNLILQKISSKMAKDNDQNRNSRKKNDFNELIDQVSSLKKQIKQISKIIQSPTDSIVKTIDKIYNENQKNAETIQKAYQIINTESPEEVYNALETFVNLTKILRIDQNIPQKVNEMKTIIEETSSILPQFSENNQNKKSKKQNNENVDLISQAKQTVNHMNFLSDAIHNLTELVNSDNDSSFDNDLQSTDLLYSKVESLKKNSESMNEVLLSIQQKLNNNDLNKIENDIDLIQEDLSVKNMLINSVVSCISSNWSPFKPNDLKELSNQESSPSSQIKRKSNLSKSVNEMKIAQFEKLFEQFTELKKEFELVLKSNATQPLINDNQKKNQVKDLFTLISNAIHIINDKANVILKLKSVITAHRHNDEIEEEEEDNEEPLDDPTLIKKVATLYETVNGISNVLEFNGNEKELIKNVQDLVDRLSLNEATFSLQSCEFETLSSKHDMSEGLIGRLCQITNANDANSLIRKVFDLDKQNKAIQKILNSEDITNQTQSIWLILTSISHILDVDKSKLPDEIQRLVNENERLSQCTNQIDQILMNENYSNNFSNQSQRIILTDKLRMLPLTVQQILTERDLLRNNVEQIKQAINEPEDFIEKVQNLFQREVKIEQILNIDSHNQNSSINASSSNLNETIPEMISKLYEFHESAIQLFKPQNKENILDELAALLSDHEERKRIMDLIAQIVTHDTENYERTEDLVDLDGENEPQSIDLINEVQNLHESNIQMKRYIDELTSAAGISPKKKSLKFKLNNSNDSVNLTQNLTTFNVKQKQLQQSNLVSFSPIRPKQAQTLNPNIKYKKNKESNKDLIQVVREMRDKENEIIEIVGQKHKENYIAQINQMKNALNSIHQLIFDPIVEEEEEEDERLIKSSSIDNLNLNSFQTIEPDEENKIETYESYIEKINQNLSEITKMKAELEYIQKTTNNDTNYIQKVGNVFDQMRQLKKILSTEKDSEIPRIVSGLVKTKESIDQILTISKQMVSTEAIERSQSSIRAKSSAKTVNISTQTVTQQDIKIVESDLISRVQEMVEMNSDLQDQINDIISVLPESENIIGEIRTMKDNEEKLKKIFKSDNLIESASQLVQTKQSIESILSDVGHSSNNQNGLVSFISQLVSENEQRKQIIELIQRITDDENNYVEKIKQLTQDEQKLQEILHCKTDLPAVTAKFVNTVDSISQIIFDHNESDSENENEDKINQIDQSNLINEIQIIFNSFNRMKKELNDLNSIMDLNATTNNENESNKELIKATKEMKKREIELKSILKTDDLIYQSNRLTQTVNSIHKSLTEYEIKLSKETDDQKIIDNSLSDDEKDTLIEINYDELTNEIDNHLSELLASKITISKIQKVTNEPENYEEKIANVMSLQKKIDSILNNSEYLPFSPITMKNIPSVIEFLIETQNEVCEILETIDFNEKETQNNEIKPNTKSSKSTATADIKKKEQKVTQIPSKVQILVNKSKILDSINEEFINEDDINSIPDQISTLVNNSKILNSIGNTLNLKKPPQIIEKVVNQVEQLNQIKQMLNSENIIKSIDNLQKENFMMKENNQKINEVLASFNTNMNSNSASIDSSINENAIEEIQNMINTINELSNEKSTIAKIVNNENPIEEIESLQNMKEKLQQMLPRKGIIPEVQKLIQTSQITQKSAKILGCQNVEFIPEKINDMKEQLKKFNEESEVINDLLKSNSLTNSISKVKELTSMLHDPDDLNEEVSFLVESLKKAQEDLANRETQERATINDLQASLIQIMRLTDKKTTSDAINKVEETEEIVKRLQKVLQVSEASKIPIKIDALLTERAKIIMNIDTAFLNREIGQQQNQNKSQTAATSTEFDFGLDNSSDENNNNNSNSAVQDTTFIYLENDELPQCIYNMKRGIRENESILKRVAEITKYDISNAKNNTNNNSVNPIDFSQIPRVVAEICQSSQLIKSIHTIMTDQDISDQMPETIQKLIQDSAELTVLTKENDELKRNYEDTCNFVKRLLSIIMEGHLPQKMKFPIPLKAKDKLLEFLRSFKKRSDRNANDIKVILKRASSNGYRDTDLIEAVNRIVDESIAFEKQQNNEDMHEKAKSLKQIIERQTAQYNAMMAENKQTIQDLKDKIETVQRQSTEKENKVYVECQKKIEKLAEVNADLDKEKRIHEELIRLISKQSIDTDFLSINLPVNEMRIVFQYSK